MLFCISWDTQKKRGIRGKTAASHSYNGSYSGIKPPLANGQQQCLIEINTARVKKDTVEGQKDIGIITPYAAQSRLIRSMILDYFNETPSQSKLFCATVHQFQGSEKDVIIFESQQFTLL